METAVVPTYKPTHLKLWTRPSHYMGAEWNGWYVFLMQTRDSDCLTRANFIAGYGALDSLHGEVVGGTEDEEAMSAVTIVRESHFLCGWVEWIAIHESNTPALMAADKMAYRLEERTSVLCEDTLSQVEYDEAWSVWEYLPLREKVEYCQKAGVSIFAARRKTLPKSGNVSELISLLVD